MEQIIDETLRQIKTSLINDLNHEIIQHKGCTSNVIITIGKAKIEFITKITYPNE